MYVFPILLHWRSLTLRNADIAGLQNEDGSFSGDEWGEIDTRYALLSFRGASVALSWEGFHLRQIFSCTSTCH